MTTTNTVVIKSRCETLCVEALFGASAYFFPSRQGIKNIYIRVGGLKEGLTFICKLLAALVATPRYYGLCVETAAGPGGIPLPRRGYIPGHAFRPREHTVVVSRSLYEPSR